MHMCTYLSIKSYGCFRNHGPILNLLLQDVLPIAQIDFNMTKLICLVLETQKHVEMCLQEFGNIFMQVKLLNSLCAFSCLNTKFPYTAFLVSQKHLYILIYCQSEKISVQHFINSKQLRTIFFSKLGGKNLAKISKICSRVQHYFRCMYL